MSWLSDFWDNTTGSVKDAVDKGVDSVKDVWTNTWDSVGDAWGGLGDAYTDVFSQMGEGLTKAWDEFSGKNAARETMDFNAYQALLQRQFEAWMSSTAYQRQRKDLELAGYNPLLGLSSPASTPSGASASGVMRPSGSQVLASLTSTARDVISLTKQAQLLSSEVNRNQKTAEKAEAEKRGIDLENLLIKDSIPSRQSRFKADKIMADIESKPWVATSQKGINLLGQLIDSVMKASISWRALHPSSSKELWRELR